MGGIEFIFFRYQFPNVRITKSMRDYLKEEFNDFENFKYVKLVT